MEAVMNNDEMQKCLVEIVTLMIDKAISGTVIGKFIDNFDDMRNSDDNEKVEAIKPSSFDMPKMFD